MSITIRPFELKVIQGDKSDPKQADKKTSDRSHLRPAFSGNSLRTLLDLAQSKAAKNMVNALQWASSKNYKYLAAFKTTSGEMEYYPAKRYDDIIEYVEKRKRDKDPVQTRHIFLTEMSLEKTFSHDEIAAIQNVNDLLDKFRQLEIRRTGTCRFREDEDHIDLRIESQIPERKALPKPEPTRVVTFPFGTPY